MLQTINQDKAT